MNARNIINLVATSILVVVFLVIASYMFVRVANPPLVDPEIERIIIDDMEQNSKLISVPARLDVSMGQAKTVYVGIKNSKNSDLNYRIEFDIFAGSEGANRSYKSVLKYQGVSKLLEKGNVEVGKVDISIPQSDFSKGDYILKVSVIDTDLDGIYASGDISLSIE